MVGHATTPRASARPRPVPPPGLPPRVRLGLLLAATGCVVTAAVAGTISMRGAEERSPGAPVETTIKQLRATAADRPIYWAGSGPGTRLELTETKAGKTFVRYLPSGVRAGDQRTSSLTVASYPVARAYAVTEKSSHKKTMVHARTLGGGLAVWSRMQPNNVYLAYPGSDVLVEVFSPGGLVGQRLVLSGKVARVGDESSPMPASRPLAPPAALTR